MLIDKFIYEFEFKIDIDLKLKNHHIFDEAFAWSIAMMQLFIDEISTFEIENCNKSTYES